jgi:hypothetical protein
LVSVLFFFQRTMGCTQSKDYLAAQNQAAEAMAATVTLQQQISQLLGRVQGRKTEGHVFFSNDLIRCGGADQEKKLDLSAKEREAIETQKLALEARVNELLEENRKVRIGPSLGTGADIGFCSTWKLVWNSSTNRYG